MDSTTIFLDTIKVAIANSTSNSLYEFLLKIGPIIVSLIAVLISLYMARITAQKNKDANSLIEKQIEVGVENTRKQIILSYRQQKVNELKDCSVKLITACKSIWFNPEPITETMLMDNINSQRALNEYSTKIDLILDIGNKDDLELRLKMSDLCISILKNKDSDCPDFDSLANSLNLKIKNEEQQLEKWNEI
ncbi:MAG: hypothetical protein KAR42_08965 [candidate division Zixibacteria bacterium]|nr:hypothetical protein [candidate division Zixibacteria bacterium]